MKVKVGQTLFFANLDISSPQLAQVEVVEVADARTREGNSITLAPTKVLVGDRADFKGHFTIYDGDNWTRLFKDAGKAKQALIKMAIKEEKTLAGVKASDLKSVDRDHAYNVRSIEKDYNAEVKAVRKLLSKLQD